MDSNKTTATCCYLSLPPSLPSLTHVASTPCAACKILRRRCGDKCMLAPYFPPSDLLKFITAHRVFGASNICKFLQELPESQRADAVSSMVYEANARIMDPVYGSAGVIFQLQQQVNVLQAQLVTTQVDLLNLENKYANLLPMVCEVKAQSEQFSAQPLDTIGTNLPIFPGHGVYFDNDNQGTFLAGLARD